LHGVGNDIGARLESANRPTLHDRTVEEQCWLPEIVNDVVGVGRSNWWDQIGSTSGAHDCCGQDCSDLRHSFSSLLTSLVIEVDERIVATTNIR
jgi:hypothetical protein